MVYEKLTQAMYIQNETTSNFLSLGKSSASETLAEQVTVKLKKFY